MYSKPVRDCRNNHQSSQRADASNLMNTVFLINEIRYACVLFELGMIKGIQIRSEKWSLISSRSALTQNMIQT